MPRQSHKHARVVTKENEDPASKLKSSFLPQINNIKMKLEKKQLQKTSDREESPSTAERPETSLVKKKNQFVEVYVRVRPFMKFEFRDKHKRRRLKAESVEVFDHDKILVHSKMSRKIFKFERCFKDEASQSEIFEMTSITRMLDTALDGYSATIFVYGQTGSGKTHT